VLQAEACELVVAGAEDVGLGRLGLGGGHG
jgi:hypothetical protein